jgi:hypothetical protein
MAVASKNELLSKKIILLFDTDRTATLFITVASLGLIRIRNFSRLTVSAIA